MAVLDKIRLESSASEEPSSKAYRLLHRFAHELVVFIKNWFELIALTGLFNFVHIKFSSPTAAYASSLLAIATGIYFANRTLAVAIHIIPNRPPHFFNVAIDLIIYSISIYLSVEANNVLIAGYMQDIYLQLGS
ncbi:hypothetical protein VDG05_16975 [Xanthomonas campestris pv. raphani]|uniref:hypothetical protein n=1 Tax=Xanthomonas campestris TaxID=339 RepID=UPI002B2239C7|nr:hypothetical protein [Xanthomonas campestris]MEA9886003.1 hypothetical protein [Xanthomonas campestris pv. raphani]